MEHPVCTIHNTKTAKVLSGHKIVIFCPECAKQNMDKMLTFERLQQSSKERLALEQEKKFAISQIWKGLLLSVYLIFLPFVLALFYPFSQSKFYTNRLAYIYQTYTLHTMSLLLIGFFFLIGLYYMIQGMWKISAIHQKKKSMMAQSSKQLSQILDGFLSPRRMDILKDFVQGLRKRFEYTYYNTGSNKYLKDLSLSQMSVRELHVYTIQTLKKLGFKNIQMNNHYDSEAFGIHFFAENEHGKNAISVLKDEIIISMDDIHQIAIGKAYYDCNECILITASKLTEDSKILADNLFVNVWNDEKLDELLKKNFTEQWLKYIGNYFDYSDKDLNHYTKVELKRLQQTS